MDLSSNSSSIAGNAVSGEILHTHALNSYMKSLLMVQCDPEVHLALLRMLYMVGDHAHMQLNGQHESMRVQFDQQAVMHAMLLTVWDGCVTTERCLYTLQHYLKLCIQLMRVQ